MVLKRMTGVVLAKPIYDTNVLVLKKKKKKKKKNKKTQECLIINLPSDDTILFLLSDGHPTVWIYL